MFLAKRWSKKQTFSLDSRFSKLIESHVGNTGNIVPFSSLNAAAVETSVGLAARGAGLDYGKIMIWNNYKKIVKQGRLKQDMLDRS